MASHSSSYNKQLKSILRTRQPSIITPLSKELTQLIPPEVIDLIIERVAIFDVSTLSVCSLVCKKWLYSSRPRLFSTISLNPRNTERFIRLLDSPYATISAGIRHISIQHSDVGAIRDISLASSNETVEDVCTPWCGEILLYRLKDFKMLTSLALSYIADCDSDEAVTRMITHSFPGLTDLEFRTCIFPSFASFTDMLCALQNLRRITLTDVSWEDLRLPPGDFLKRTRRRRPALQRLRTLELYISPIGHFVTWLSAFDSESGNELAELRTVRLCSIFWDDMDTYSISRFLKKFAPKIKHLSLPWHLPEVNFSVLTSLRSLRLSHLWFQSVGPRAEEFFSPKGIEKTLKQLSSPFIESIGFRIQCERARVLPEFDWLKVAEILSQENFTNLREVTFGIPAHDKKLRLIVGRLWNVPARQRGLLGCRPSPSSELWFQTSNRSLSSSF